MALLDAAAINTFSYQKLLLCLTFSHIYITLFIVTEWYKTLHLYTIQTKNLFNVGQNTSENPYTKSAK